MSTSKELVELSELYTNITERKLYQGGNNQSWRNKGTDKDKEDAKKEGELEKVLTNLKNSKKDEKDDDKEEIKGPNITTSKSNNKSNTVDLTNTTNNKTDNKSNNNEKPPIKVDIKDKDGKVIGNKTIHSGSSEYKDASQGKGDVKAPSEMGTDVKGINVKTGNIVKTDKKEVKPEVKEVKPETYLGKDQGLLNKADWLKKTSRSPAAKSGAFSDDQRWAQQLKHRQWQKDNNRGKFKAKTKEVPSKFAANKEKDTFKRRDQKLLDKGLKPPTYTNKVKVETPKVETPKVETPKTKAVKVETPKVETPKTKAVMVDTPKVEKKKTFQNKITAESYDAYDLVLNYIMETEQASSIEEANYIMLEMDQNTIHEIVVEQKKTLGEGIKTAVGLGMLALPYAMSQLEKRWNPVKKARDNYQNKKATEYEKKSGTTKEDGYFR